MTARTSKLLADALKAAGFEALAIRAEADEFHDFLSPHAMPSLVLDQELLKLCNDEDKDVVLAATKLRNRHHEGEFDADLKESDDWAASDEGRAALGKLGRGE